MTKILLFGAGKSATCLIRYLIRETASRGWELVVAESNLSLAQSKVGTAFHAKAVAIQVENEPERDALINDAAIVISLLPPALHYLVAVSCVKWGKDLLTASYLDESIKALEPAIREKGLLFIGEMGLDPGIDHMSAMQLIHRIRAKKGRILSFRSHTGGLVAPESDDNPWHYKISWNPRNVVLAGSAGARYKDNGQLIGRTYQQLFEQCGQVVIEGLEQRLSWYPNRDSLSYIPLYGLEEAATFLRTTLRYPDFCRGWAPIVRAGLTDDHTPLPGIGPISEETALPGTGLTADHAPLPGTGPINVETTLPGTGLTADHSPLAGTGLTNTQRPLPQSPGETIVGLPTVPQPAAPRLSLSAWSAPILPFVNDGNRDLLTYLGLFDNTPVPPGARTSADVLQHLLETRLAMGSHDKDMIVMLHEITYTVEGKQYEETSSLLVKGTDPLETAMAKTVGLPLGIAAKLILEGKMQRLTGLHIPILREIYEPVLNELAEEGIRFEERSSR